MTHYNLENENEIRRFLLGEMAGDERTAFEAGFLADQDQFESVKVVEDELIEAYVRGQLDAATNEKFERRFLTTAKRRERVAFTRAMLEKLAPPKQEIIYTANASPSLLGSLAEFFKRPAFAGATAFAVLLIALAGWLLFRTPRTKEIEIVRQDTPTPAPAIVQTPVVNGSPVNENINTVKPDVNANRNENTRPEKPAPAPQTVTLALFAGTLRSGGSTGTLNLPKEAKGANLILNLEATDYKTYRADIVDQNGDLVFRSGPLKPRGPRLTVHVPSREIQNGDYLVKLTGLDNAGHAESVADYQFRVDRSQNRER